MTARSILLQHIGVSQEAAGHCRCVTQQQGPPSGHTQPGVGRQPGSLLWTQDTM